MNRTGNRAIAYLRMSTEKQDNSLFQQLEWAIGEARKRSLDPLDGTDAARVAIQRGIHGEYRFQDIYLDDAISGSDLSRAGFNAMLRRVKEDRNVAFLLVWDRSRFGRFERSEVGAMFEKDVREAGVTICLHDATLPPRRISDGSLSEDILAMIEHQSAGKYRMNLAENVLRGQSRTVREGYWPGGTTPYGFIRVLVNKRTKSYESVVRGTKSSGADGCAVAVIPGHDEESRRKLRVVKFIVETYHQGHLGLHRIAKELNKKKVPSPYAGRTRTNSDGVQYEVPGTWTVNSVASILINPLYSGKMAYGRRGYGSLRRFDKDSHTGYRHVENYERIPGTNRAHAKDQREIEKWLMVTPAIPFEPIVPFAVWEANQRRLEQRGQVGGQRGRTKCADPDRFPLHVVCADCGERMVGHYHAGDRLVFKCSTWLNSGCEKCHPNWVDRNDVVAFVLEAIRRKFRQLVDPEVFKAEVRKALQDTESGRDDLEDKLRLAQARLTNAKRQLTRLIEQFANANSDEEASAVKKAREEKNQLIQATEAEVRDLETRLAELGVPIGHEVERTIEYLRDLDRLLDDFPEGHLRNLFDTVGVRLTVRFMDNPGKGRRHRLPTGGTLAFGVGITGQTLPENDPTSAGAEVVSPKNIGFGCGGRI